MRVAVSTLRSALRGQPSGATILTEVEIASRLDKQEALNLCVGHGCGDCCGRSPIWRGEFSCPLFEAGNPKLLSADQLALAATCGVPVLYFDVVRGAVSPETVTTELVRAACPFLEPLP